MAIQITWKDFLWKQFFIAFAIITILILITYGMFALFQYTNKKYIEKYYDSPLKPTFYESKDYSGAYSVALDPGAYNTAALANKSITNNSISSLKVPDGFTVILFEEDNFTGNSTSITKKTESNLDFFDNKVSSLIVAQPPNTTHVIDPNVVQPALPSFYEDRDYTGKYKVNLDVGFYTLDELNARHIGNDSLTSVRVPSGFIVVCFKDNNFGGPYQTFTKDTPNFNDLAFNDLTSSIIVSKLAI